jgi:hypothetical protein
VSLLFSVLDQITCVLWAQCHHHIEEVVSVYLSTFWKLIRHVSLELWVFDHLWPKVLNRELVILRHINPLDFLHGEEGLFFSENLFEEILVHADFRRYVELTS